MSALIQQFTSLPRAVKWLIYLMLFMVGFFLLIKPALNFSDTVSEKAAKLESALAARNDFNASESGNGGIITALQGVYGTPLRPGGGLNPESFRRVVNGILENHNITDSTINERPKVQMSGLTPEQASALGIASVDRLILEVTFEAHPEDVIAILAELERSPEVASVSRVKIDKAVSRLADDDHLVRATLTPEAWIAASSSGPTPGTSEVIP